MSFFLLVSSIPWFTFFKFMVECIIKGWLWQKENAEETKDAPHQNAWSSCFMKSKHIIERQIFFPKCSSFYRNGEMTKESEARILILLYFPKIESWCVSVVYGFLIYSLELNLSWSWLYRKFWEVQKTRAMMPKVLNSLSQFCYCLAPKSWTI